MRKFENSLRILAYVRFLCLRPLKTTQRQHKFVHIPHDISLYTFHWFGVTASTQGSMIFFMLLFSAEVGNTVVSPAKLVDPELILLATSIPDILDKGSASFSSQTYKAGWPGWVLWSYPKTDVHTRPTHPYYVTPYLNHWYFVRGHTGCVISAFYGMRWVHHMVGLESPTDTRRFS